MRQELTPVAVRLQAKVEETAETIRSWGGPTADFETPEVEFIDKTIGRSGQCRARTGERAVVEFNLAYGTDYADQLVNRTGPHEVAHAACAHLASSGCITWKQARSHGKVWKSIMRRLGADDSTKHDMQLKGRTRQKRKPYVCGCEGRTHQVTTVIRNRIAKGTTYRCKLCKTAIRPAS